MYLKKDKIYLKSYGASTIYKKDHAKKTVKNLIAVCVNGMF